MSKNLRLLIAEPDEFSPEALSALESRFIIDRGPVTRDELIGSIGDFDGLVVRLGHRIDREVLERAARLAFILSPTTGLNHIDVAMAEKCGVNILSLKGERDFLAAIRPTAELTWSLLLALARRLPAAVRHVNEGGWNRDAFKGFELSEKTLGVVGFGRLGSMVAQYGRAFGMKVLANDPKSKLPNWVKKRDLDTLCAEADVITLHVPSEPSTRALIGPDQFARMRASCLLINTSRGDIVDEAALLDALESGRIAGAALDVLEEEFSPAPVSAALRRYAEENDTLLITPHIGGATVDSMQKTERFMAERLMEALDAGHIKFR